MKAMSQCLKFGKSVSDNGWGMFTVFLKYKLEEMGKRLVKTDKFYASSQLCNVCGYKNTLGTIWWNDEDAYSIDVEGRNLEDAKRKDLNNIKKQMKANSNEDYIYLSGNIYGAENEWYDDDVKNYKAEDYLKDFIGFIEGSYVDGDSSYALALVDFNKEDVLLSGSGNVNFVTFEEFQDMFEN
jgi:hypothetical protein